MIVLKATLAQYNELNSFENEISKLKFVKDGNDNWIVGIEVLTDPDFEAIRPQLNQLTQIEYIEPKP